MSIKCMSRVWESARQKGASLLCLLAIADFADDNGFAWPAIATIAKKTRMSARHTSRILQALADERELCIVRRKANQSNLCIVTVGLSHESFIVAASRAKEFGGQGDILSWWGQEQGDKMSDEGDILSGEHDILSGEGDKMSDEYDIAVSSDPSLPSSESISEPSENRGASAPKTSPPSSQPSSYSQTPERQAALQEKHGRDPLDSMVKFHQRQEAKLKGRPAGWGSVDDMPGVWAICELVAEQFPCSLPLVRRSYNAATREMALQRIDRWAGGAALLLEKFNGDARRACDAITTFRRTWDGGFTVAGPQSLLNSVGPGIVSKPASRPGSKRGHRRNEYEPATDAERAAAWKQYGSDLADYIKARGSDENIWNAVEDFAAFIGRDIGVAYAVFEAREVERALAEEPLDPKTFFAEE